MLRTSLRTCYLIDSKLIFTLITVMLSSPLYAQKGLGNEIYMAIEHINQRIDSMKYCIYKTVLFYI